MVVFTVDVNFNSGIGRDRQTLEGTGIPALDHQSLYVLGVSCRCSGESALLTRDRVFGVISLPLRAESSLRLLLIFNFFPSHL